MDLKAYLAEKRAIVDKALGEYMSKGEDNAAEIMKAMNYSLFAGGKRLRPIMCIAGAEAVGGYTDSLLPVACALELIHTYSLIHDDLPSMDNDDVRRGKPTNHKVFGEGMAVLAGDGLLTEAFYLMTKTSISGRMSPDILPGVIGLIASAAGHRGMVGGQAMDILMEGEKCDSCIVEYIHSHKTGALISASVTSGTILGGGTEEEISSMRKYGDDIGLAFQIADDILDIEGDSHIMGKNIGSDQERGKITFPSVFGVDKSKKTLNDLVRSAIDAIELFDGRADPLRKIAQYIIERKK
ncbi:MAG: polyprenyl synthetase family protein [Deltaproteobacteria bacterium]|nr:polyprenyl synthetase family protein [Deltaproteobacteria bacterium]